MAFYQVWLSATNRLFSRINYEQIITIMKDLVTLFLACILIFSCNGSEGEVPVAVVSNPSADMPGFYEEEVPGTDLRRFYKEDEAGNIVEDGFMKDGLKQGPWLTYERPWNFPKTLTHYEKGVVNGIYLSFSPTGQIDLKTFYKDNKLDGPWIRYKSGRKEASATYVNGELHGVYREYMALLQKLEKEIYYKNGLQDGLFRHFNSDGQIILEYTYKKGEKVSGGLVDPPRDVEPTE